MQDANRIPAPNDVDHPKSAGGVANPDLSNTRPIDDIGFQSAGERPVCSRCN